MWLPRTQDCSNPTALVTFNLKLYKFRLKLSVDLLVYFPSVTSSLLLNVTFLYLSAFCLKNIILENLGFCLTWKRNKPILRPILQRGHDNYSKNPKLYSKINYNNYSKIMVLWYKNTEVRNLDRVLKHAFRAWNSTLISLVTKAEYVNWLVLSALILIQANVSSKKGSSIFATINFWLLVRWC